MLFSEVYGKYFNTVAAVLTEAVSGGLTENRLNEIVLEKAFSESMLYILPPIKNGEWKLVGTQFRTPIKHTPTMPLTTLQKQWLKALLLDPRIQLFNPSCEGLEDAEPLYRPEDFCYFDRYADGDPYEDSGYIAHFRTVLKALDEKRKLFIRFSGGKGGNLRCTCIPYRLEYSAKDDKFRLLTAGTKKYLTINVARIQECSLLDAYKPDEFYLHAPCKQTLVLELEDERNALERTMLQFSYLEKETVKLDKKHYRITIRYDLEDETEILISVLSFGPVLRVIYPESFIQLIKERLIKQQNFNF
jgi:hypothetical protein